jgi:hypothetical protein
MIGHCSGLSRYDHDQRPGDSVSFNVAKKINFVLSFLAIACVLALEKEKI